MVSLYKVGGYVRDVLMGVNPNDIDYAVEAKDFAEMKEYIMSKGYIIYIEKERYGYIKAKDKINNEVIDFTLCRKDGFYSDHRRPVSITSTNILNDLARRDFTINSIAINVETGDMIDPFNGQSDIEKRIIKCVGNTKNRIDEDPLRLMRAIRLSITKHMEIDEEIMKILRDDGVVELLSEVNDNRKIQELRKSFQYDTPKTIKLLGELSPKMLEWIFTKSIWLNPTNKKIK